MLNFTDYKSSLFVEAKNLHIPHIEDELFTGASSVNRVIASLDSIANMLKNQYNSKVDVTTKFDGSPSIISGINPENGLFFVATKGLFNNIPKICHTQHDIDSYFAGDLHYKMSEALKYLPELGLTTIYQGDLMYTQKDLEQQNIKGVDYITFQPNTIIYAVPATSATAKTIQQSKLGVIFHTEYIGDSISNLSMTRLGAGVSPLNKTKNVWFDDANFKDLSDISSFSEQEENEFFVAMSEVKMYGRLINKTLLNELVADKQILSLLKMYTNQRVRDGEEHNTASNFIEFVGRKVTTKKRDKLVDYLTYNIDYIKVIFLLHHAITRAKMILIDKLAGVGDISTFIKDGDKFKVVAPEGFVATSKLNNKVVKLIDRLSFSKNNFNKNKG